MGIPFQDLLNKSVNGYKPFNNLIWAASESFAARLRHTNSTYRFNMTSFAFLAGSPKFFAFTFKAGY